VSKCRLEIIQLPDGSISVTTVILESDALSAGCAVKYRDYKVLTYDRNGTFLKVIDGPFE